jgi:MFS family permease
MSVSEIEHQNSSPSNLRGKEKRQQKTIEDSSTGFINVLSNNNFLILWLGQIFSQLADKIYLVLMIAIISSQFQPEGESISSRVSLIMIAFTLPAIFFGSLAGVYVDRWSKKSTLILSNIGRGILVFLIPFCLSANKIQVQIFSLPFTFCLLLLITFLVSTLTQFFAPAEQASLPLIIKKKNLLAANSIYTTTMMAMLIIGFAIGEPLLNAIANWTEKFAFNYGKEFLVGFSYTLAGVILIVLKTKETDQDKQTQINHPWQDIKDGLSYLKYHPRISNAMIQLVILFSIFAALAVLAVSLAETIPGMETDQFGYLLATAGVGIAIGAAIVTKQGAKISHYQLSLWGLIGIAVALVGLSFSTKSLFLALSMTIIIGICAALVGVPMQTTIQGETPAHMRGKVFGLQNNAVNIALSLPLALVGIAQTYFGLKIVLISLAIFALLGMGVNFTLMTKKGTN